MRLIYTTLLTLLLPLVVLRLMWRSLRVPGYRQRIGERFGLFAQRPAPDGIWIHAVSVGEAQAVEPLVRRLLKEYPQLPLTITTTTPTGSARVIALFGDRVFHVYCPYDIPIAVNLFLKSVKPRLLVMVETEIWPNLLTLSHRHGVYSLLANARLSERSARGYRRLGRFTRELFASIDLVAAQNKQDMQRFADLGVPAQRLRVTGSIKFDLAPAASLHERAELLKLSWGGRPVWVAASTHEGEEEPIIAAHREILRQHPLALLVLVPRHPDRFARVAAICERSGLTSARRSAEGNATPEHQILLGDTMGELTLFFAAADAAFVGGSLVETGGHNILEPAACGIPLTFGPHTFNFALIAELLLQRDAARRVASSTELAHTIGQWLGDASERSRIGENAKQVVEENRGALNRLYELVMQMAGLETRNWKLETRS